MKAAKMLAWVAISCLVATKLLAGQPSGSRPTLQAVRIERNIELTGKLSDPQWQLAQPISADIEVMPRENTPAEQKTLVRILYNSENFYIGFDCRETNPSEIRAHISDRDRMFNDDYTIIILDTYGDNQRAYELFVNPYGIQGDILLSGGREDASFDMIWKSAAAINDSGWTVEMEIPFKSLRFLSTSEQTWGMLAGRSYPRSSRAIFSWTPYDRNNPCLTCQGGILKGIRGVEATSSVEVLPYVLGSQSRTLVDEDVPSKGYDNGKPMGHIGGGFRYSPSPNLSLDAVVNPDFSQVESDAQQISVNTTFALFYPEKRPFFTQGLEVFQSGQQGNVASMQIFYSRLINDPLVAAKVAGKNGKLSFLYLAASDRHTPYLVPGEEASDVVESSIQSFSNIARAKYDFADESHVGASVTTKNSSTAHNYVGSIDWKYLFAGNYYFRGAAYISDTKEVNDPLLFDDSSRVFRGYTATLDGERYTGSAGKISISRSARDYSFTLAASSTSPTFQAQDGFVASNNYRFLTLDQNYNIYPNNSYMDLASFVLGSGLHYNTDGVQKERWFAPGVFAQMKGQTNLFLGYMVMNDELFKGVQFENLNRWIINLYAQPHSSVGVQFSGQFGRFIYRDNPSLGTGHEFGVTLTLRPTSQLHLETSYNRARLSDVANGSLYYDGNISRVVGIYQFTAELFLRIIGQYNSFGNPTLNVFPLLSYKVNPFTIFYVGMTDDSQRYSGENVFTSKARQFFVKFQYLFRS